MDAKSRQKLFKKNYPRNRPAHKTIKDAETRQEGNKRHRVFNCAVARLECGEPKSPKEEIGRE